MKMEKKRFTLNLLPLLRHMKDEKGYRVTDVVLREDLGKIPPMVMKGMATLEPRELATGLFLVLDVEVDMDRVQGTRRCKFLRWSATKGMFKCRCPGKTHLSSEYCEDSRGRNYCGDYQIS